MNLSSNPPIKLFLSFRLLHLTSPSSQPALPTRQRKLHKYHDHRNRTSYYQYHWLSHRYRTGNRSSHFTFSKDHLLESPLKYEPPMVLASGSDSSASAIALNSRIIPFRLLAVISALKFISLHLVLNRLLQTYRNYPIPKSIRLLLDRFFLPNRSRLNPSICNRNRFVRSSHFTFF